MAEELAELIDLVHVDKNRSVENQSKRVGYFFGIINAIFPYFIFHRRNRNAVSLGVWLYIQYYTDRQNLNVTLILIFFLYAII